MRYVVAYFAAGVVFLAADAIWLGWIARTFYRDQLGELMLDRPSLPVAAAFYALYVVGIVIFAVTPGLREQSWRVALIFGALFGFFAYATYDLTNLATLRNWPMYMSMVDLGWGTFVTALAAVGGYSLAHLVD